MRRFPETELWIDEDGYEHWIDINTGEESPKLPDPPPLFPMYPGEGEEER